MGAYVKPSKPDKYIQGNFLLIKKGFFFIELNL